MLGSIHSICLINNKKKANPPPPTDSLLIYLKFLSSDISGTTLLNYGSIGNCTLETVPSCLSTSTMNNLSNQSISYGILANTTNTNNCRIKLPNYQFSNNASYTVSLWMKPNKSSGGWVLFFYNQIANTYNGAFILECISNGMDLTTPGAGRGTVQSQFSYGTANIWIHVCYTITITNNSTITKFYLNSTLIGTYTNSSTQPATLTNSVKNGYLAYCPWDASYYYSGSIRGFRMYNRALTANEVKSCYLND